MAAALKWTMEPLTHPREHREENAAALSVTMLDFEKLQNSLRQNSSVRPLLRDCPTLSNCRASAATLEWLPVFCFVFAFFEAHCCLIRHVPQILEDSISFSPLPHHSCSTGEYEDCHVSQKVEKLLCATSDSSKIYLGKQPEQKLFKFNKDTGKLINSPGTCTVCRIKARGKGKKKKKKWMGGL